MRPVLALLGAPQGQRSRTKQLQRTRRAGEKIQRAQHVRESATSRTIRARGAVQSRSAYLQLHAPVLTARRVPQHAALPRSAAIEALSAARTRPTDFVALIKC